MCLGHELMWCDATQVWLAEVCASRQIESLGIVSGALIIAMFQVLVVETLNQRTGLGSKMGYVHCLSSMAG